MLLKKSLPLALTALLTFSTQSNANVDLNELAKYANISVQDIKDAMAMSTYQKTIIKTMTTPYESKPWYAYKKLFIIDKRINEGVDFYLKNEQTLKRAEAQFGVPASIITAIIGVETFYGKNMGSWSVLDALYTLGFNYPPREAYFSKEFANYIKLAKRENWNLKDIKGSYAGAMGMGQFMPSSYLNYAIDFNNDGHVNILSNVEDAIGSVANYFKAHGWKTGDGVLYQAHVKGDVSNLLKKEWDVSVKELKANGVSTKVNLSSDQKVRLYEYQFENDEKGYAVALHNFYVITRYNKSPLYATAVYELSELIESGYKKAKLDKGVVIQKQGRNT